MVKNKLLNQKLNIQYLDLVGFMAMSNALSLYGSFDESQILTSV